MELLTAALDKGSCFGGSCKLYKRAAVFGAFLSRGARDFVAASVN